MRISDIETFMGTICGPSLAESWDNVGLLVGDPKAPVNRIMTCLSLNEAVVTEACQKQIQLIITHHPFPFYESKKITTATNDGRLLIDLLAHRIAVYSAHTAFDNAPSGINQQIAALLKLQDIVPLNFTAEIPRGRCGQLQKPVEFAIFGQELKRIFSSKILAYHGNLKDSVQKIGIACGAAASFIEDAHRQNCDVFVTGEVKMHDCLYAQALGLKIAMLGHYNSERFAMVNLAQTLQQKFEKLDVLVSENDVDPVGYL